VPAGYGVTTDIKLILRWTFLGQMNNPPPIPTSDDVQRIINIADPVIRNLQITQCYHELSAVLAWRTRMVANWCTFATWASKQAGQTIRKEDLRRLLESRLKSSLSTQQAAESFAVTASLQGQNQFESPGQVALRAVNFTTAIERASQAISRGNKKVFEEIGGEFARFYATCLLDPTPDDQKIARFCGELRPGLAPEGQSSLRQAFTHYYQALFAKDVKTRAELILLANIEIGFHEQTRLQPEIAESLDVGLITFLQFARPLIAGIFPMSGWFALAHLYVRRLLGRPTALDLAIQALLATARSHLRQTITEIMMTISLPSGVQLRLSKDLANGFPDSLKDITNSELRELLQTHDPTPNSSTGSGVLDWADLPDRLHFIIDLFRCYQENQSLFSAPFMPEQVQALRAGKIPTGRL
jgi:hypothetical protein